MGGAPILYWRRDGKRGRSLPASPFRSEQEFEQTVFDTPAVFGDIYLLRRQIRGGGKPGIPDMIGIDSQGQVCVIEMKNTTVDASVIPQVLKYAIWAETNPDSIKALWLEDKNRPEGLSIDWEEYSVRILIVAPSIDRTTLEHVNKIAYPVDLIEITRWAKGKEYWLLVNKLEPLAAKKNKPVSGLISYDKAAYVDLYNPQSVTGFLRGCKAVRQYAHAKAWRVEDKFTKAYYGFKVGNYVVFGIKWIGTRSYGLFFKVPEPFAKRNRVPGHSLHRYETIWKRAVFAVDGNSLRPTPFQAFFEKALESRSE